MSAARSDVYRGECMKTVKFLYGHTTFDLDVPDDTPVLTSHVDELKSDKSGP